MKKYILLAASLLVIITGCNTPSAKTTDKIIGEWKGMDKGMQVSFIFDKSNNAKFIQGNNVIGGGEFVKNGKKLELKYEIDYSNKPIWLDLVVYEKGANVEMGRKKGIVRFLSDNKIEYIINFSDTSRPDLNEKESSIVLTKVQ
jgi:hypothetical protein